MKTKIVKHVWPKGSGVPSTYELQVWSHLKNKWFTQKVSYHVEIIRAYCAEYGFPIPAETIECQNHK